MPRFSTGIQLIHVWLLIAICLLASKGYSIYTISVPDSLNNPTLISDSLAVDSLKKDSLQPTVKKERVLDYTVNYTAKDSMRFNIKNQTIYMYGQGVVDYGSIKLEADYIEFNMSTSEVFAKGVADSTGKIKGKPLFTDDGKTYDADEIRYNFETKKGLIKNAVTQEGEGYIQGETVKRQPDEVIYVGDGQFCPCEDPNAGTYIRAKKIKIIPQDKIVTGPANLVIADIPTPLVLPFGIFPNTEERASGLIIPQYGNSPGLGFFLTDGGYYWAASPFVDFSFTGDIYTNGSWGTKLNSSYRRRYKHNGNYNISYSRFLRGERELPNFSRESNFFIRWNHSQDRKANPAQFFSATVNAGTSNNFRTNFNSRDQDFLNNQFNSNIQYSLNFPNQPFSLALNASHSQNTLDSTISITLPSATFNMQRLFPFKNIKALPNKSLLKDIGINFSANARNAVTTRQDRLLDASTLDLMQSGLNMNTGTSLNLKVLKYFTLTPSFNANASFTTKTIEQRWNSDSLRLERDTIPGIRGYAQWNTRANLSTTVYGMYNFKEGSRIKAIRHRIIPTVGVTYAPGFADENRGWYRTVRSGTGENQSTTYSIFQGTGINSPNRQQNALLTFQLNNNLEMKTLALKDTSVDEKKIKLIENLNIGGNYNFLADSLKLSNINMNANTSILNNLVTLNGRATFDPYQYNENQERINQFLISGNDFSLARMSAGNISVNFNLQSKKKDKKEGDEEDEKPTNYMSIPWRASVSYVLDYRNTLGIITRTQTVQLTGSFNLTENWDIDFRTGYDFTREQLSYTSFNVYRDLNCWEMRISVIPFGLRKSYTFSINIKPAMLKDLKFERNREWFDFNDGIQR